MHTYTHMDTAGPTLPVRETAYGLLPAHVPSELLGKSRTLHEWMPRPMQGRPPAALEIKYSKGQVQSKAQHPYRGWGVARGTWRAA